MNSEMLDNYARLLIEVGLNVQKGQPVLINCPVDCADFARRCVKAGYDAGASHVTVRWTDDFCTRQTYLRADSSVFDSCEDWYVEFLNHCAETCTARLSISAGDPENLIGVDPDRLKREQIAFGKRTGDYRAKMQANFFQWCVGAIPTPSWAKKVYPNCSPEEGMNKLWQDVLYAVRVTEYNDPVSDWKEHIKKLEDRTAKLQQYDFKSLHYHNSIGTDLTVELPENHVWEGGGCISQKGVFFVPNMPTEEIFTAPKHNGVNGKVVASLPLVRNGNIIKDIVFTLKNGKITSATASQGEEILQQAISVDEGASSFGEVALIPYHSPISDMNVLFYKTLFDENASCHFAFGSAYPTSLKNGDKMNESELYNAGLNTSITHVDFMVGTKDLSINGLTHDGRCIPIFINGNFSSEF